MLRLIPGPLRRVLYRSAHRGRRGWWMIARPALDGCRIIARDAAGQVLLVRHSYGSGAWMLPGGGLRRGEDPLAASVRECAEETGCALANPRLIAEQREPLWGAINRVRIVTGEAHGVPRPDGGEIVAAGWFAPDALPEPMSPTVRADLARWLEAER